MKTIQINGTKFFDLLKSRDQSMWEIFAQMVDGEEKQIFFLDDEDKILFDFILPDSLEKLEEARVKFTEEFQERLNELKGKNYN